MRQFQNLLPVFIGADMLGDPLPIRIDADFLRACLQSGFAAHILHGDGIRIALKPDGCLQRYAADLGAAGVIGTSRQRQEGSALFFDEFCHRARLAGYLVGSDVGFAAITELLVQLGQGSDTGDGNQ